MLDGQKFAAKQIALKSGKLIGDKEVVKEIELLRRCQGPRVVPIREVFQAEGSCFIITEYMAGGTLDKYCTNELSRPQCRRIFRELLEGLVLLHEAGVVHHDIKPENILLTADLGVKIGDFGLSCEAGCAMASEIIGTPGYIAPEVFSRQPSCGKMDVFSAGLTGRPLFKGNTAGQRFKSNESNEVDLEFLLVPEPERTLLMLLLHPDAEQRVTAAEALADPYFLQQGRELFEKKTKENTLTYSVDIGKGLRPRKESLLPNECEAQRLPAKNQTFLESKKI